MPSDTSRVTIASEKSGGWRSRVGINIAAAALALLGAFLASGDALGQAAPAELSLGGPSSSSVESSIAITAQVSLVWRHDAQIMAAVTNFSDSHSGADATNGTVVDTLQKAAVAALSQAAMSGADSGHVDVVATVYQFARDATAASTWAPIGIFINTTDMAVEDGGKANFHTHVQFIPDASRAALAGADAPAR